MTEIPLIEFLKNRIYLGAYDYVPEDTATRVYLTIDDTLPYNNFHHDFGPLNIAHLYRFAVILHDVLGNPENEGKELVFYSYTDPRSRANAATLLASYMVLLQHWQPHQVLAPIAQMTPVMPFRDAGYSVADFIITLQDVVYALWRAKNNRLIEMQSFDLDEHEYHELIENGDLNLVGDHFVAFASPVTGNPSINPVLKFFKKYNVRLVVRLNSHLYDKMEFEQVGIKHIDLIFEDGTCPTMAIVQGFIGAAEGVIKEGGKIAVHCRAGLGRTGCLIGAHLIYTYGFTAQEAIAYMRFLRPGMVVGPQQHWLYQHQNEFRDWRHTMKVSNISDPSLAGYSPLIDASRVDSNSALNMGARSPSLVPHTPERNILTPRNQATTNSCLPQPTPGQPRKSPSPINVRDSPRVPVRASRYQSGHGSSHLDTNSDDESSLYDCSDIPDDNRVDSITLSKRGSQPQMVTKVRSTSRSAQCSLGCSSSSSKIPCRSLSRKISSRSTSRSTTTTTDSETSGLLMLKQRRNLTEMTSPSQQMDLAKQLRVASNPTPHRRVQRREELEPVKPVQ